MDMENIYTSADQLIGNTPLLELTHIEKELGLRAKILAKLEYLNPAGSAKDCVAKEIIPIKGTRSIGIIGNTLIAVASVFEIVGYYLWERRAKKAIQNGEQPSLKKILWGKVNVWYLLMIGIICMG